MHSHFSPYVSHDWPNSTVTGQFRRLAKRFFLPILSVLVFFCPSLARDASAGVHFWTTNGPEGGVVLALAIDPDAPATLYAGTEGGVFKSSNGGGSWTAVLSGAYVSALAIDPSAPATLYAGTYGGGVFKSTNAGGDWIAVNTGVTTPYIGSLAIDPSAPATLYAGTSEGGSVFKSSNGGGSWTAILTTNVVSALAIDPSAPATIYAGGRGVLKSIDGGGTWTTVTGQDVVALAVDPSTPGTLYAGTLVGTVMKSVNGGGSWTARNVDLVRRGVYALAVDPSAPATLYAGTETDGVFKSIDGGGSWAAMNAGLTDSGVYALAIDSANPATLYAGTYGAGVFDYQGVVGPCAPSPTTLCLNGGRFQVQTHWTTRDGSSGPGQARAVTGDSGYFTFFDPANVEVMVKVLNGCSVNGNFWTFAGGLTGVSVVMTVGDSQTGAVKTYTNLQGTPFPPILDTNAFATCAFDAQEGAAPPAGYAEAPLVPPIVSESFDASAAACVADATTLCLNDSRYKVQAQWFRKSGASGAGQVIPLTEDTGAFWFFGSGNVEIVIKVLNGCDLNSRHWVFAGGLTNVDVTLTVTDTQTGTVKTYTNAQGTPFPPIQDTSAFEACP